MKLQKILYFCFIASILFLSCNNLLAQDFGRTANAVRVHIIVTDGKFTVKNVSLIGGRGGYDYAVHNNYHGKMHYGRVVSASGKALGYFQATEMSMVVCWDNFDPKAKDRGGCFTATSGEIDLRIPYFSEGKTVEFFDQKGKKILSIDISSVAR